MMNMKLHTVFLVLLSLILVACHPTIPPSQIKRMEPVPQYQMPVFAPKPPERFESDKATKPCLLAFSHDPLLSVIVQEFENCKIPVNSFVDVSWTTDNNTPLPNKHYNFIVFTMPHTVRFNGTGFLMLPPEVKLPFGFEFEPDQMRVLFPLYLLDDNTKGQFQIKPLMAGNFTLKWDYLVVNEDGNITFSSSKNSKQPQFINFEVVDEKPFLVVQDRVGMEKPDKTYISPSKEYELRVFKDRFQVLYANTGELLFERVGTNPNFSPGSRFLGYFTDTQKYYSPSIEIIDVLNQNVITKQPEFQVVAWGKNDSFLIVGFGNNGIIKIYLPFLVDKNVLDSDRGINADNAWEHSLLAIDLENALLYLQSSDVPILYSIINCCDETGHHISYDIGDFIKYNDYVQLLQSLGLPIHRKSSKVWTLEESSKAWTQNESFKVWKLDEGFKVSHIGYEKPGMKSFFLQPISLKDSKSFMRIAAIEKKGGAIRGNSHHRGTVARFNLEQSYLSKKVKTRLNDMAIVFYKNNAPLKEEKEWVWTRKKELSNMLNSITINHSVFHNLVDTTITTYLEEGGCYDRDQVGDFALKHQLWDKKDNELLLIQLQCTTGAASNIVYNGYLFVFSSLFDHKEYKTSLEDAVATFVGEPSDNDLDSYLNLNTWNSTANEIKSFLSEDNMLLIASIDGPSITVFDANENKVKAFIPKDIPESQDLESLHLSQDGRLVVQINQSGRFYFYDIASQKRVLNGLYIDDEIVLYTDDGFYDATPEGTYYITWHYPSLKQHFDFNQFESKFKRPDVIKGILTGQPVKKPNVQLLPPPTVEMVLKHPGNDSKQATVELNATSVRPITNMRLFMDGAPVVEIPVTGRQVQKTVPLELKRGKHWITAVAYNDQGYSSIPQSVMIEASHIEAQKGHLYVLGIGVDQYPNMPYKNLNYAKRDIMAFTKTTKTNPAKQYQQVDAEQLLDSDATRLNIQQALTTIAKQATVDDTLMLYFSGHGERGNDGKFYFLTPEASFEDFETTGLAWEKVAQILAQTKAKVIVFLDACHSGVASNETLVPNDEYVAELMKTGKAGMVVMAASKGRQFSLEGDEFGGGHGAFNYAITRALQTERQLTDTNQNGIIELSELYRRVKFNVYQFTNGKQTPWLSRNEIIGEMPFF